MGKRLDLKKQKFGRLTVIKITKKRKNGRVVWMCRCGCGNICEVKSSNLMNKITQSCGCLQKEQASKSNTIHGMHSTPAYRAWQGAIQRCENSNHPEYKDYGGRGITISEEFHDFQTWYDHIGPCPGSGYSQDRIENDGNYERGNIQWATAKEQRANTRPFSSGKHKQHWFRAWHEDMMCQFVSNSQREFARRHGLSQSGISFCILNKIESHKGWRFERI